MTIKSKTKINVEDKEDADDDKELKKFDKKEHEEERSRKANWQSQKTQ